MCERRQHLALSVSSDPILTEFSDRELGKKSPGQTMPLRRGRQWASPARRRSPDGDFFRATAAKGDNFGFNVMASCSANISW